MTVTEDAQGFVTAGRYIVGPTATATGLREQAAAYVAIADYLDHMGGALAWRKKP